MNLNNLTYNKLPQINQERQESRERTIREVLEKKVDEEEFKYDTLIHRMGNIRQEFLDEIFLNYSKV